MDASVIPQTVKDELAGFDLTMDSYKDVMNLLHENMMRGLAKQTNPVAKVKMIPSYVTKLPTGNETGQFLALDLGGTNYRILLVTLRTGEKPLITETTYSIKKEIMTGTGEELFKFIAQTLSDFIITHKVENWPINLGFTFSFPCRQKGLAIAYLIRWTKGFSASGCENEDVAQLLQEAIDKLNLKVKVVALVNDTVGTLTSCALQDPKCGIGLIIGTGTNASYIEKIKNIELFEGPTHGSDECVINMEWGAFGEDGCLNKFRTKYDETLDKASINPSQQIYEKMASGMYLGELVRFILKDLNERGLLFQDQTAPDFLNKKDKFETKYLTDVEFDPPHSFDRAMYLLNREFCVTRFSDLDAQIVRYVCEKVSSRAARIIGSGIACLINHMDRQQVTVGIDGSLYKFHPKFDSLMKEVINNLKKDHISFELKLSEDGSGKGAAAIAASV